MKTMKNARIGVILLLAAIMMVAGLATAQAAFEGDYEYEIEGGGAVITGYRGGGGDIEIPDTINKYPVTRIDVSAFRNNRTLVSVVIPEGVTTIGGYAFQGCFTLTSVTFPESLTAFGKAAFKDCTGLREVVIPGRITTIADRLFYDCVGLNTVVLPDSVTIIDKEAFYGCKGLTDIIIPASVQSIDKKAFEGARNVTFTVEKDSYAQRVAENRRIPFIQMVDASELFGE